MIPIDNAAQRCWFLVASEGVENVGVFVVRWRRDCWCWVNQPAAHFRRFHFQFEITETGARH